MGEGKEHFFEAILFSFVLPQVERFCSHLIGRMVKLFLKFQWRKIIWIIFLVISFREKNFMKKQSKRCKSRCQPFLTSEIDSYLRQKLYSKWKKCREFYKISSARVLIDMVLHPSVLDFFIKQRLFTFRSKKRNTSTAVDISHKLQRKEKYTGCKQPSPEALSFLYRIPTQFEFFSRSWWVSRF